MCFCVPELSDFPDTLSIEAGDVGAQRAAPGKFLPDLTHVLSSAINAEGRLGGRTGGSTEGGAAAPAQGGEVSRKIRT